MMQLLREHPALSPYWSIRVHTHNIYSPCHILSSVVNFCRNSRQWGEWKLAHCGQHLIVVMLSAAFVLQQWLTLSYQIAMVPSPMINNSRCLVTSIFQF